MSSEIPIEKMWLVLEDSGIDRKTLEQTEPSDELIFKLYTAIKEINEKRKELEGINNL